MPIKNLTLINQSEIARKLGISKAYVNMILHGKRKSDKYEQAIKELINKELGAHRAA
ncbi:hypothetical protein Calab_1485 [Caldithrix abyssi DSM 13497]|uniref:HTH cro/C1-type domain-containing protein n=1 Tax=Caldithrix abyssi DSM 13497 TaxID=880073 RepID=H1XPY0_CALAY|nr:helix-turn-helix transcriptional regulator [Caldithrix abyssi]APF20365.1 hypothetical protein Cabys_3619 [Caldithrix abyssi DSM 13497]EHO41106.1 hypothetical protein Calab_1485 [Caldithrix abyssi DSM 13497]